MTEAHSGQAWDNPPPKREIVEAWLDRVRPALVADGGNVELVSVDFFEGRPEYLRRWAPLYLLGAQVRRTYPYVEVIDNQGLTIAVVSYEDRLFFGITSDRDVIADLGDVAASIEREFLALADAVSTQAAN